MGGTFRPELGRSSGGPAAKEPRGPIVDSPFHHERVPLLLRVDTEGRHHIVTAGGLSFLIDPECRHWASADGTCRLKCWGD